MNYRRNRIQVVINVYKMEIPLPRKQKRIIFTQINKIAAPPGTAWILGILPESAVSGRKHLAHDIVYKSYKNKL